MCTCEIVLSAVSHFSLAIRCGYVLQPDCMRDPVFDPTKPQSFGKVEPVTLTIVVSHLEIDG